MSVCGALPEGLLDAGRSAARALCQELDGLALGQVLLELVQAALLLEPLAQLLGLGALLEGGVLERVEDVAVGGLDALLLDDGGQDGLAAQGLLGVRAGLLEELLLGLLR